MTTQPRPVEKTRLVVGVTGHRNLRKTELPRLRNEVRGFFEGLKRDFPELPLTLLAPLAAGADQLVAGIALELGIHVIAVLPVPSVIYRDDFEDAASLEEFNRQLAQCETLELDIIKTSHSTAALQPEVERNLQYAQVGVFTSSHSHILLALWDGTDNGFLAGTAQVVQFHLHGSISSDLDRHQTAMMTLGLDEESLVYHIPTGRENDDHDRVGAGYWLTSGEGHVQHSEMPKSFVTQFKRQSEYNQDRRQYREQIAKIKSSQELDCPIQRQFIAADWLATTYRRRVARILLVTYLLTALTGYSFILYSDVMAKDVMIYLFLLFFLAGIGINSVARRREWHRQYIDYRALAEGLRVQSYWRRSGIVDTSRPAFAYDNFLQKQDVELGWIRNVMRSVGLDGMLQPLNPGQDGIDKVIGEWIGSAESPGQLAYYSATSEKRVRQHRRNEWLALTCLWLGISLSVVLAVFALSLDGFLQNTLVVAMGVLSVTAAVHEAYAYKKADKELIKQYRFMVRIFSAAKSRLEKSRSIEEKHRILSTLGEAALTEHAEWTLMHRERPLDNSKI